MRRAVRSRLFTLGYAMTMLAACASLSRPRNDVEAEALARAESAFAAMASSSGVKAAFLDAMAEDATLFRPGPVNGKAFMGSRPDPAVVLEWRPQRVSVAESGELGYSTGPWKLTSKKDPGSIQYGQFFTVWRQNAAGRWHVLIDHGISHPTPAGWNAPLEKIAPDAGSAPDESVAATEARFSLACERDGLASAYRAFGSRYLRVLRDDEAPIDGLAALDSSRVSSPAALTRWTWTSTDTGTARSSDLGWTMGRYRYRSRDAGGATKVGYYVRMWRAEAGAWKIAGDVLAPIDEPAR
jgi:ketosteroid isomerase-like protein